MTRAEAIKKLEFSKKAYQKLIDEKVDEGTFIGDDICGTWKANVPLIQAYQDMIEALAIAINSLKVDEKYDLMMEDGGWIPVSERLPKELDYCLCCDKDGYMTIGFVSKYSKEWCFDDNEVDIDVVAWMPLPEPYKDESEEN